MCPTLENQRKDDCVGQRYSERDNEVPSPVIHLREVGSRKWRSKRTDTCNIIYEVRIEPQRPVMSKNGMKGHEKRTDVP